MSGGAKKRRDAEHVHPIGDEPQRDRSQHRSSYAADAAGKLHAPKGDRRHRIEPERLPHRRIAGGNASGEIDSGDRARTRHSI